MKKLLPLIIYTLVWGVLFYLAFYYVFIPKVVEKRAKALNLMTYDSSKDKMVSKDTLTLSGWELYYLQYGNMNGY